MMEPAFLGILVLCLAGAMSATFSVPMKFTVGWEWENIWGLGSGFALLTGWGLAFLLVPDLFAVYGTSSSRTLFLTLAFGAGWGLGAILFGLGVHHLGVSLGVTIILSLNAVVGSVLPLLIEQPARLLEPTGLALLSALGVMIAGLSLLGYAGHRRELELAPESSPSGRSFQAGLWLCVASGCLSPLANFAFIFGEPLVQEAARRHGPGLAASTAPWALAFTGCFGLNVFYCLYLSNSRGSVQRFWSPETRIYWAGALVMGTLWTGAMFTYGWGASLMGWWGPYIGFPTLMIASVAFAQLWGLILREWRGASSFTQTMRALALLILLVAFAILGWSNTLTGSGSALLD